jgi:hypothetical protein
MADDMTAEEIVDAIEDDMTDEEWKEFDNRMWAQVWWDEQLRRHREGL